MRAAEPGGAPAGRRRLGGVSCTDPEGLAAIAATRSGELRLLGEAFDRLSREYPSTRDGLSLTERRVLAAVADGAPDAGARVLAGDVDQVARNGIDRWIGGVHLRGRHLRWRWDDGTETIVRVVA